MSQTLQYDESDVLLLVDGREWFDCDDEEEEKLVFVLFEDMMLVWLWKYTTTLGWKKIGGLWVDTLIHHRKMEQRMWWLWENVISFLKMKGDVTTHKSQWMETKKRRGEQFFYGAEEIQLSTTEWSGNGISWMLICPKLNKGQMKNYAYSAQRMMAMDVGEINYRQLVLMRN